MDVKLAEKSEQHTAKFILNAKSTAFTSVLLTLGYFQTDPQWEVVVKSPTMYN